MWQPAGRGAELRARWLRSGAAKDTGRRRVHARKPAAAPHLAVAGRAAGVQRVLRDPLRVARAVALHLQPGGVSGQRSSARLYGSRLPLPRLTQQPVWGRKRGSLAAARQPRTHDGSDPTPAAQPRPVRLAGQQQCRRVRAFFRLMLSFSTRVCTWYVSSSCSRPLVCSSPAPQRAQRLPALARAAAWHARCGRARLGPPAPAGGARSTSGPPAGPRSACDPGHARPPGAPRRSAPQAAAPRAGGLPPLRPLARPAPTLRPRRHRPAPPADPQPRPRPRAHPGRSLRSWRWLSC